MPSRSAAGADATCPGRNAVVFLLAEKNAPFSLKRLATARATCASKARTIPLATTTSAAETTDEAFAKTETLCLDD
jgi:hypothetical protein